MLVALEEIADIQAVVVAVPSSVVEVTFAEAAAVPSGPFREGSSGALVVLAGLAAASCLALLDTVAGPLAADFEHIEPVVWLPVIVGAGIAVSVLGGTHFGVEAAHRGSLLELALV